MLMTGSLGMLASTLPVQWLLPLLGWRGLFAVVAVMLALAMVLIAALVPRDSPPAGPGAATQVRYREIVRHPLFASMAPLAFFLYGGMIAVQALWAGPWLTRVAQWSAGEAAQGLFFINLSMLVAFGTWGLAMPRLARRGLGASQLMAWGVPLPLLLLALNALLGEGAGAAHWAAWCVACTFVSLSQPAVGAAFPAAQAGRALSAFNLVIFSGVFLVQWGVGVLIDRLRAFGWAEADAYRCAMAVLGLCCALSYAWFVLRRPPASHNPP
jgi:predicted MFS family arabinose efflux permease